MYSSCSMAVRAAAAGDATRLHRRQKWSAVVYPYRHSEHPFAASLFPPILRLFSVVKVGLLIPIQCAPSPPPSLPHPPSLNL